jgi:hypothetical protein
MRIIKSLSISLSIGVVLYAAGLGAAFIANAGVPDGECILQKTYENGRIVWVRLCL